MKEFGWDTIISIVGALAWTPWIFQHFRKPKLKCKVVGLHVSSFDTITDTYDLQKNKSILIGSIYTLYLSCISLHKNFVVNNIVVKVNYPNFTAKDCIVSYPNIQLFKKKIFKFPVDNRLTSGTTIAKESPTNLWLNFVDPSQCTHDFDSISITVTNYLGGKSVILINRDDINLGDSVNVFEHL